MNRPLKAFDTRALLLPLFLFSASMMTACGQVSATDASANPTDSRDTAAGADASHLDTKAPDAADVAAEAGHGDTADAVTPPGDASSADTGSEVATPPADSGNADMQGTDGRGPDAGTDRPDASCAQAPVALGGAAAFVVLAGSTVTNAGLTSLTGDLGVSPGTAVTGFGPGMLVGNQHAGDPTAAQAESDLITAYNNAAGRTLCAVTIAGNLGGQTLAPGLYKSTTSLEISSGDLTLDAQGDPSAVFIFQMASTLTTSAGRQVILSRGARAANIFWQVGSSATFGTTSAFQGTVMADQAIALTGGATLTGRALARAAAVTLDTNTAVLPAP